MKRVMGGQAYATLYMQHTDNERVTQWRRPREPVPQQRRELTPLEREFITLRKRNDAGLVHRFYRNI